MDLHKGNVEDYLNDLQKSGLSEASIDRKRSALSKFLSFQNPGLPQKPEVTTYTISPVANTKNASRPINTNKASFSLMKMLGVTILGAGLFVAVLVVHLPSHLF